MIEKLDLRKFEEEEKKDARLDDLWSENWVLREMIKKVEKKVNELIEEFNKGDK